MHSRRPHISVLATIVAMALSSFGVKASDDGYFQTQLGLIVEYFEVDHAALPPLLRDYQNAPDATELIAKVQAMESAGKARLVESSYTVTTPEQTAEIKSIREFIYPSDYLPAEVPHDLTGPIDPAATIIAPAKPSDDGTRFIGNMLEFKPTRSPDSEIYDVEHSSDIIRFTGFKSWGQGVSKTQTPLFHGIETTNQLRLKPGRSTLLGTFIPADETSTKRLLGFATLIKMSAASASEFKDYIKSPPTPEQIEARNQQPTDDPFGEASDNDHDRDWTQVSVITEYIEVDAALSSQIVRQLNTISDATSARHSLDKNIASGEATLLDIRTSLSSPGVRNISASFRETTFPSIFDPPGNDLPRRRTPRVPGKLAGPIVGNTDTTTQSVQEAFESHQSGIRIEIEPNVSTDRLISLNLQIMNGQLVGEIDYGEASDRRPLFEHLETSTNVNIPDGTTLLLSMHSLETAQAGKITPQAQQEAMRDRRILVFLTAKIKTIK